MATHTEQSRTNDPRTRPPGAVLGVVAAVLALAGLACLTAVVIAGLQGGAIAPIFTWAGMVLLPLAFLVMLAVLAQGIVHRSSARRLDTA